MRNLLQLQNFDLQIESCKEREMEIPLKKEKFNIHKKRLAQELNESENLLKKMQMEQRNCETDIEGYKEQIIKYETQLYSVKKNEEYNALLNEIELAKKHINAKEERIIQIMMEMDEAKIRLEEDKKRINTEQGKIDDECKEIDKELEEAIQKRKQLEDEKKPVKGEVNSALLAQYNRIRKALKTGKAAVPVNNESCSGCFMKIRPQIINELLAGKVHHCQHCGRLLYDTKAFADEAAEIVEGSAN